MDSTDSPVLYFAYGSNLNIPELVGRGFRESDFVPVSKAWLPDRELRFSYRSRSRNGGVLDVVPKLGSAVPGMLFSVPREILPRIDAKEGAPYCYRRLNTPVIDGHGLLLEALTYEVVEEHREPFVPPTPEYLGIVNEGLAKFGLDTGPFKSAAKGEPNSQIDSLFIYGTLMRGQSRHHLIRAGRPRCILLSEVAGSLFDCGAYPALRLVGASYIKGEFCRFSKLGRILRQLDEVEGFNGYGCRDNLYDRTLTYVGVGGRIRFGWTYTYSGDTTGLASIEANCWRRHTGCLENQISKLAQAHHAGIVARIGDAATPPPTPEELTQRLLTGDLEERRLAQMSGLWSASSDG